MLLCLITRVIRNRLQETFFTLKHKKWLDSGLEVITQNPK